MVKVNNNVPPTNSAQTELMHGDFSTFQTNLATPQRGEVVSVDSNKSVATDAKVIQDVNTKLLIKSLNGKLQENQLTVDPSEKKVQYNPKEVSVD